MSLRRMLCAATLAGALFVGMGAGVQSEAATTAKDGQYYYDQLKAAMMTVLTDNQKLINSTADGGIKSEKLLPENLFRESYQTFKTVMGADFSLSTLEGERDPEKIASALTAMLQAARDTIAKVQEPINTEPDGSIKLKKFIPAVFGRLTVEEYKKLTGVEMKQTTLGKGGYKVRNDYNAPTDWEQAALAKFTEPSWPLNAGFGAVEGAEYRYVKPIYIKKGCLSCHGTPIGEKDAYGHPKEGYQEGEVRGGISVVLTLGN